MTAVQRQRYHALDAIIKCNKEGRYVSNEKLRAE